MKQEFFLDWSPDVRDHTALLQRLVDTNLAAAGPSGHRNIAVMLRDADTGEVVSGIWGIILYGWLCIELLHVDEGSRRQGLGSRLLAAVENAAREQGCEGCWLSSYGFQAPGFFETNGYERFGALGNSPPASGAADTQALFYRKSFGTRGPLS